MENMTMKDDLMLLKAIEKAAKQTYDIKAGQFINELLKMDTKQYRGVFGTLGLRTNKAKFIKVYTPEEQAQIQKLDEQIEKLQAKKDALGVNIEAQAEYKSLVATLNTDAEKQALALLKTITNSKSIINTINKQLNKNILTY